MKFTCGLTFTLLVLMFVVATKGHTVIQCYVCDDCAKIDKNTPLEQCGGENFTMTTTTTTSSSMSPSESKSTSSTEAPSTTTTMPITTTTTTTTTQKTTEFATPPTVGPISSTTDLPTPPSLENTDFGHDHDHMNHSLPVVNATSTTTKPPSIFVTPSEETVFIDRRPELNPAGNLTFNETFPSAVLVRQRRHTEFNGITYHCYKVQKKYGNVYGTKRGCMGVKTEQSVCDELYTANGNQTKKCSPCTTTKCNGSSSLGVSIATLLVALMALVYKV
ncbi:uncharacterized protein LOC129906128 [Episyrphus balteatus]|uniref:uncharacterized protein LOC129906128 n=1 Tax=Episyrphus balteatus TaxID=286459 RepID=UPI0024862098|nr:uncharacterized protein LOC129906128 [Episyrphus balteatus]